MAKVIGLVNLHSDIEFTGLTERRPVASVSFLGRMELLTLFYQICQILK